MIKTQYRTIRWSSYRENDDDDAEAQEEEDETAEDIALDGLRRAWLYLGPGNNEQRAVRVRRQGKILQILLL